MDLLFGLLFGLLLEVLVYYYFVYFIYIILLLTIQSSLIFGNSNLRIIKLVYFEAKNLSLSVKPKLPLFSPRIIIIGDSLANNNKAACTIQALDKKIYHFPENIFVF